MSGNNFLTADINDLLLKIGRSLPGSVRIWATLTGCIFIVSLILPVFSLGSEKILGIECLAKGGLAIFLDWAALIIWLVNFPFLIGLCISIFKKTSPPILFYITLLTTFLALAYLTSGATLCFPRKEGGVCEDVYHFAIGAYVWGLALCLNVFVQLKNFTKKRS